MKTGNAEELKLNKMERVLAAGGVVINQNKELLMIFRNAVWDLPKGHWQERESLEECAVREVKEETGLKAVALKQYLGISEHVYFDNWLKKEVIKETHWYEMKADKGETLHPLHIENIEKVCWIGERLVGDYLQNSFKNLEPIVRRSSLFS